MNDHPFTDVLISRANGKCINLILLFCVCYYFLVLVLFIKEYTNCQCIRNLSSNIKAVNDEIIPFSAVKQKTINSHCMFCYYAMLRYSTTIVHYQWDNNKNTLINDILTWIFWHIVFTHTYDFAYYSEE